MTRDLQGVTHDASYWYFSNEKGNGALGRYSKAADLGGTPSPKVDNPFPGWTHPGDIDYSNGWIYVALEVQDGGAPRNAIGVVPTATFGTKSTYDEFMLPAGHPQANGQLPWVARDPITGYLYSSLFSNPDTDLHPADKLYRYKVTFAGSTPTGIQPCGHVDISPGLRRVQGGAFSESGRLYLATDPQTEAGISAGAIKVVEMNGVLTGRDPVDCNNPPVTTADVIQSLYIQKEPGSGPLAQEVEGITVWDRPAVYGGRQIGSVHTILLNNDVFQDNFWFKHLAVSSDTL